MRKHINRNLLLGIFLLSAVLLMAILSFFFLPYPPNLMDTPNAFLPAFQHSSHLLGTDQFGRDVLSRIMIGSRTVLLIGFVSVILGAFGGVLLGSCAALIKGFVSAVIMRGVEGLMAFPGTLLALMLVAMVGKGTLGSIIAISIYTIVPFARLTYTMILENENLLMVKAARSFGVNRIRMLKEYYLPIMLPRLLTQFSASVGSAVLTEAALSFLGLGVQAPDASWGLMLSDAKLDVLLHPDLAFAPGIAIFLTVLGFHLLSDGLNDLLIGRSSS